MKIFEKYPSRNNLKWILLILSLLTVFIRLPIYKEALSWPESADAKSEYLWISDQIIEKGIQAGLPGPDYALKGSVSRDIGHPFVLALIKYLIPPKIPRPYCLVAILLDVITLLCIFKLSTYFSNNRICQLLVAALFAIYPAAIKASAHAAGLRESWIACLVAISATVLLSLTRKPSIKKIIILGLLLSGLYFYNGSFFLFVIVTLLWLLLFILFHPVFKNSSISQWTALISLVLISLLASVPSYVTELFAKQNYRTSIRPEHMFWDFLHTKGLVATFKGGDPIYISMSNSNTASCKLFTTVGNRFPTIRKGLNTVSQYGLFISFQVICANIGRLVWFSYNELASRVYIGMESQNIFHKILMVMAFTGILLNLARAKLESYILFSLWMSNIILYALVYAWSRYNYQIIPLLFPFIASVFEGFKILLDERNIIRLIFLGLSVILFIATNILSSTMMYVAGSSAFLCLVLSLLDIKANNEYIKER